MSSQMARMVATKAALSIRVDALTETDDKSDAAAPSIGLENRAKLEARLRALEAQADGTGVRSSMSSFKQQRFQMTGETKTYNTAADAVDLVPAQREPVQAAVQAALDVKAEKKKAKEERRAKRRAEKEQNGDAGSAAPEETMEVDGARAEVKEEKKEKKRKRRESEVNGDAEMKVRVWNVQGFLIHADDESVTGRRGDRSRAEGTEEGEEGRKSGRERGASERRLDQKEAQEVGGVISGLCVDLLLACRCYCLVYSSHNLSRLRRGISMQCSTYRILLVRKLHTIVKAYQLVQ